ncbi:hypothetical protein Rt10032_c09g3918 [Rhodotorula toruloides]|uniref:Uncharacterized protein n=1 Tax=Rhodotorula toruloides TaxID=5286 RepID=A0A511KHP7_RHOTO|nr:hypothetical protein Rt10032_c09g3918 [Rhodotorula toruloides]
MGPEAAKVDERSEGEFMGWSEKKLGKRKAVEGDEGPSLRHEQPKKATKRQRQASADKQRQRLAASSAKVDSRIRLPRPAASSSRVTPAPDYSEYSSHADGRPYTPYDIPTLHNTTSELLSPHSGLSSSHSDSIPSLQGSTSSTSTSRFLAMALQQPHPPDPVPHGASPFSARSTAASYGEKGKERARWAEERDADGAERGQGTASAEKETSDDELPPADSADDSADLDLDPKFELELDMTQNRTQEDEGVQGEAAGFEELSQDTVLHDSQGGGESQDRDRGWEEEEEEEAAPKDGWDAQRYGAAAR